MTMTRSEELTRQAAAAIGHDLTGYTWSDKVRGMLKIDHAVAPPDVVGAFRPMTDPCDAYLVETTLQMNVRYEVKNGLMAIHFSSGKYPGLGYMTTTVVNDCLAQMRARMYAATQFAAIVAISENE